MAQHVCMPRLSQDMTQGRIVAWLTGEGGTVNAGDPLVTVETDKAEVELPAPCSGVLRRILRESGQDAEVGAPLAVLGDAGEDIGAFLKGQEDPRVPTAAVPRFAAPANTDQHEAPAVASRQPVSPAARRTARELGVDLRHVAGTGAGGLVTEGDVRAALARTQPPPAAQEDAEVIPLTGLRRRIAERMSLSRHSAADVTTVVDVDMTAVADLRAATTFSYTAYVVEAVARALRKFPILNASLAGDRILVKRGIHIGVAVSLDEGLVVPVIRFVDTKNVAEISRDIDTLAARAREGRLGPEDMAGGTFTVSNSGAFGSLQFTPIINHPEVAILGMGKVQETPVARHGLVVIRKVMYACLSYDHRVVDGGPAVTFLNAVKHRLEHPRADDTTHE